MKEFREEVFTKKHLIMNSVSNPEQVISLHVAPVCPSEGVSTWQQTVVDSCTVIDCSMAGCFPERLRRCLIEQVCQTVKCKVH